MAIYTIRPLAFHKHSIKFAFKLLEDAEIDVSKAQVAYAEVFDAPASERVQADRALIKAIEFRCRVHEVIARHQAAIALHTLGA